MTAYRKSTIFNKDSVIGQIVGLAIVVCAWFYLGQLLTLFWVFIISPFLIFGWSRYLRELKIDVDTRSLICRSIIGTSRVLPIEKITSVELIKAVGFSKSRNLVVRRERGRALLFEVCNEAEADFSLRFIDEFLKLKN